MTLAKEMRINSLGGCSLPAMKTSLEVQTSKYHMSHSSSPPVNDPINKGFNCGNGHFVKYF
jgi:hypothetical protein